MTTLAELRPLESLELIDDEVPHWSLHVWDHEDDPGAARFNVDGAVTAQRLLADYRVASLVNAMLAAGSWCREPGGDWVPDDHTNITVGTRMITAIVSVANGPADEVSDRASSGAGRDHVEQLRAYCRHIDALVDRAKAMLPLF